MKNRIGAFLVLIYALFFILLFFATDLVLAIPLNETYRLQEIERGKYQDLEREFDVEVESFIENQDILNTAEVSGYAFIQTGQESKNKTIKLVFASEDISYEVETEVLERFELRDLFIEKGIIGINHGFITRFSPLNIKNGIYKLFIYCFENDGAAGVIDTNVTIEKTNRSIKRK